MAGSSSTSSRSVSAACGPAVPTTKARVRQRPLGIRDVRLTGGVLARWQRVNRDASIPLGLEQLEKAGNLDNLRLTAELAKSSGAENGGASSSASGPSYRGPRFSDSDVYKQLEAVAWECGRETSPELVAFIDQVGELLEAAQREDGYLNSYYQVVEPEKQYAELHYSHEMYCAGHLMQAAVALARIGEGEKVRKVAERFADHLVTVFLEGGRTGIDGHPEVETALVELYRVTGNERYLELARKLVDERGKGLVGGRSVRYVQDHMPVRDADTLVGHAVRALYLEAGIVDLYLETGDESLLESSVRRWEDLVATKLYITGGVGSRHAQEAFGDRYELPPDRAYAETCAAIANIHWNWRLLLATGKARYADLIERTLYNGFAASTSTDGTRFFYVNPLQRRHDHYEGDDPGRRHEWYSCACCPPNIMRLVASLGHYVATVDATDAALFVHQFTSSQIRAELSSGSVDVNVETDYPWDGKVSFTVTQTQNEPWTLALRDPAWSRSTRVSLGGSDLDVSAGDDGYIRIARTWEPGDVVTLELDMSPRLVFPHHRVDALRGCAAIERGPLLYCFEQIDQEDDVELDDLALAADTDFTTVELDDLAGIGRTVTIHVNAVARSAPTDELYSTTPPEDRIRERKARAVAVPYFLWDNRDAGPMRVWLPVRTTRSGAGPTTESGGEASRRSESRSHA
ncbi:MAG TPA: beta-L-arabinofuranosidase domain-containing protein [Actinopolymorphaceae bacterium]